MMPYSVLPYIQRKPTVLLSGRLIENIYGTIDIVRDLRHREPLGGGGGPNPYQQFLYDANIV